MLRLTIKLVIAGLLAHAAYRVAPPFLNYYKFRDAAEEVLRHTNTTSFSGQRQTPEQMLDKLVKAAAENDVPLERKDFQIQFGAEATTLHVRYTVQLEYLPRQYYPYEFIVSVNEGPPRYGDYIP